MVGSCSDITSQIRGGSVWGMGNSSGAALLAEAAPLVPWRRSAARQQVPLRSSGQAMAGRACAAPHLLALRRRCGVLGCVGVGNGHPIATGLCRIAGAARLVSHPSGLIGTLLPCRLPLVPLAAAGRLLTAAGRLLAVGPIIAADGRLLGTALRAPILVPTCRGLGRGLCAWLRDCRILWLQGHAGVAGLLSMGQKTGSLRGDGGPTQTTVHASSFM